MKNLILKINIFLAVGLVCISGAAAFAVDYSAIDTTTIAYGARSMALGRSSAALSMGTVSMFSNPAGTTSASPWGITSLSTQLLHVVNYQMLAGTCKYGNATFGVGYLNASTPAGYYTTDSESLSSASQIAYSDSTFVLSYAAKLNDSIQNPRSIGDLSIGANLKLLNKGFSGVSEVSGYTGSGYALDLGCILDKGDGTAIGASLSNLLSSVSWASGYTEPLASSVTLGASKTLADGAFTLTGDADISLSSYPLTLHAGAEYNPFSILSVRVGFDQSASTSGDNAGSVSTNLTAGLGVNYQGFNFDYAYRSDSTLSDNLTHYFSISYAPPVAKPIVAQKQYVETSQVAQSLVEPVKVSQPSTVDTDLARLMELDK